MTTLQLLEFKSISAELVTLTGLHIGSGSDTIEIGGMDNPIIKDPFTGEPYIPGSSLKGKIRSLLEWKLGKIGSDGGPCKCNNVTCEICRIFGVSADKERKTGPTRLIVRDARIHADFINLMKAKKLLPENEGMLSGNDLSPDQLSTRKAIAYYTIETKSENNLNRVTAVAVPRSLERVAAGTTFHIEMIYRVFDFDGDGGETDLGYLKYIKDGLAMLESDALGGYGSRGCGRVKISNLTLNGQPWD